MPRLEDLLAAVCAAPGELAPRQAYAAAVRATSPERARLIELQLEHRALRQQGGDPDDAAARQLARTHGAAWAGTTITSVARYYAFYGGFVELVELDAAALVQSAAALVHAAPLRHLRVRTLKGKVAALASLPQLSQVVSLDVAGCQLDDSDVATLVSSPHLRGLRMLTIASNATGLDALRAIGRAALPALRFVDADLTDAPLVIRTSDWDGSIPEVAWTRARATVLAELGPLPWLEVMDRPHVDAL